VLDPKGRVLLIRYVGPEGGEWWVLPGGGMERDETAERAVVREVEEETGIGVDLGPLIWTREFVFPWGKRWIRQSERIYLVTLDAPALSPLTDTLRSEGVLERRWWTRDELDASDEHFAPRRLSELLRELLDHGPPGVPIDVGA
jgi:ADP-ribose pyrophosphatase YjhB (NUDIX family)